MISSQIIFFYNHFSVNKIPTSICHERMKLDGYKIKPAHFIHMTSFIECYITLAILKKTPIELKTCDLLAMLTYEFTLDSRKSHFRLCIRDINAVQGHRVLVVA